MLYRRSEHFRGIVFLRPRPSFSTSSLDEYAILPGQNWHDEIEIAVRTSDVVLVCISKESLNKEGFVEKEIRYTLDVADEKPEGTIFLIPVRLEECDVPAGCAPGTGSISSTRTDSTDWCSHSNAERRGSTPNPTAKSTRMWGQQPTAERVARHVQGGAKETDAKTTSQTTQPAAKRIEPAPDAATGMWKRKRTSPEPAPVTDVSHESPQSTEAEQFPHTWLADKRSKRIEPAPAAATGMWKRKRTSPEPAPVADVSHESAQVQRPSCCRQPKALRVQRLRRPHLARRQALQAHRTRSGRRDRNVEAQENKPRACSGDRCFPRERSEYRGQVAAGSGKRRYRRDGEPRGHV